MPGRSAASTRLRPSQHRPNQRLVLLHNGEHDPVSVDGDQSDAIISLKGGGPRYPYPKEVWSPAGVLDKLRLSPSTTLTHLHCRWLVDEAIKLEGKYCHLVRRNTWGVIRCLDCER
jgi:hypothetical protein